MISSYAPLWQCWGFPGGPSGKEPACQCRRHERRGFSPWTGKVPWRGAWQQPTPVFLPGGSHGQRSQAGYSPWGHTESETTEATQHAHTWQYWSFSAEHESCLFIQDLSESGSSLGWDDYEFMVLSVSLTTRDRRLDLLKPGRATLAGQAIVAE